jgi:hypothetical protein
MICYVQLAVEAPLTPIGDTFLFQCAYDAESKQQMLNLPGETVAGRGVANLRLTTPQDSRPSICRKKAIQEKSNLIAREPEDPRGYKLACRFRAIQSRCSQPLGQGTSVIPPALGNIRRHDVTLCHA